MDLRFSVKYKDYEIRACPKRLASFGCHEKNTTIELVKWEDINTEKPYCFTLAYFRSTSGSYNLTFVNGRPFEYITQEDLPIIWNTLKQAHEMLEAFLRMEDVDETGLD